MSSSIYPANAIDTEFFDDNLLDNLGFFDGLALFFLGCLFLFIHLNLILLSAMSQKTGDESLLIFYNYQGFLATHFIFS